PPSTLSSSLSLYRARRALLSFPTRRSSDLGSTWFLAMMNGSTARTIKIPLAFLDGGKYQSMLARDLKDEAAAVTVENISISRNRSEEHTSELQSLTNLVCRLLLEKKKKILV